jgi:hypothetical protein
MRACKALMLNGHSLIGRTDIRGSGGFHATNPSTNAGGPATRVNEKLIDRYLSRFVMRFEPKIAGRFGQMELPTWTEFDFRTLLTSKDALC